MSEEYPDIPEYIKKMIASGRKIDEIRIDRDGNWFHNGEPFTNKKIINYFNNSIDITEDGTYVLRYSRFVYPILVEDVPFFISGVRFEGSGNTEKAIITFTSREEEELDVRTLQYKHEVGLYCRVRKGRMPAKFRRSPSFQILDRLEENEDIYYLNISGNKIVLKEKMEDE
ncbi:MAG: DUF1285 domain-containing protein [Spirochaetota bacterium]|nr:DUF1285 domain-containing protein [Spirochaetota bacterium]